MHLRFNFGLLLILCCFQVAAKDSLDHLIKQQKNSDESTLRAHKLEKKDVYSNAQRDAFTLGDLPQEKNCFIINRVELEDNFLGGQLISEVQKAIAGRCVGSAGVQKIAAALQDYYINAGYITTRISIPSQDISKGKLRFQVNAGKIEKTIVEGNDISEWMLPFQRNDILNIRDIEQGLENLQRVPDVDVKINIEPGTRDGYSIVHIDTHRGKNWSVRASYNNWGDEETGRYQTTAVGYLFNPAKMGDLFYLAGTRSTTGQYENVSSYYSIPVGYWEYGFFYSKSKSQQVIPLSYISLDYVGTSEYLSAKATRTVYRDKTKKFAGSAELIRRKSNYTLNGEELTLQARDMGNIKLGLNYKQQLPDAFWDSTLSWQRFLTWFGGEKTPDMQYGDVSPVSNIFNFEGNYTRQIKNGYYNTAFFAQYAPRELTLQDQITVGDRWSIRGFENSVGLSGNDGFYIKNTLAFPLPGMKANYYAGLDFGQVYQDASYGDESLVGAAVGIDGNIKSLEYNFSVSTPLKYPATLDIDRVNVNFNFSYQM
ncbi:TPA: ShlB/FhaC/HecB family hemolysin secretion/activation protein [Escherichia coli]|nr:ShlB/FhaC/HecB family hemolysin secretion/activation protein [Escherichia coli]